MNFTELLEIQRSLQIDYPVKRISHDALLTALFVECGELLQLIKPQWAWWKRHGASFTEGDRAAQIDELADILHFLLINALRQEGDYEPDNHAYDETWHRAEQLAQCDDPASDLIESIYLLTYCKHSSMECLQFLARATTRLEFTRQDLEQAYLTKAGVNRDRFTVPTDAIADSPPRTDDD